MTELRRELGAGSAVLITVGAMLGSGVFATPHEVAGTIDSPRTTLALWLAGGALSFLGAVSFAELGAAIPETGGMYVYLRRAFGPFAAFAFAWAMTIVLVPSSIGFFAQVTAQHIGGLLHGSPGGVRILAVGVVLGLVGANVIGVRTGAAVQSGATVVKFAGVLLMAAIGLVGVRSLGASPHAMTTAATSAPRHASLLETVAMLVPVLWAYDGWIDITSIAGEVKHPSRNVPRALLLGTAVVTGLYLLVNIAYLRALGPAFLARSETPAADAAAIAFGATGRVVVSLLVAISTFGGCAVALLTGSRVVYAVARDGLFLRTFARTSPAGAPYVAVIVCGVLAMGYLTAIGGALADLFVVGAWPFYAIAALATIRLRRTEPDLPRPHRTLGYPVSVIVFSVTSIAIVASYAITRPGKTFVSIGLIALAAPVYAVLSRRARS